MGNSSQTYKPLFEKYASTQGNLGLKEIEQLEESKVFPHLSLPLLFYFDKNKTGNIVFDEFVDMKKTIEKNEKKFISTSKEENKETKNESSSVEKEDKNILTPMYTNNSQTVFKKEILEKIQDEMEKELEPIFTKSLFTKEGRNDFLDWIFNFTNIKKDKNISHDELTLLLKQLKRDGIEIESFLFSEGSNDDIVERIFREYKKDFNETKKELNGLNRKEFSKFSEFILVLYEKLQVETLDLHRIGDWYVSYHLGKGAYGYVKCMFNCNSFDKRAMKVVQFSTDISKMSQIDSEIQAMTLLEHPNVVKLFEVIEGPNEIYLFMELCGGGNLLEYIKDVPFTEDVARFYFHKLIDGLSYCHEKGVCHRDLRLENLLLDNKGTLKISDFGQARIFSPGWDLFQTQVVGSLYHLSPEQIEGKVYSGEKVDIWNSGIILYSFLTARLPFCSTNVQEMLKDIRTVNFEFPDDIKLSDEAKDLIKTLLQVDPEKRPSLKDIKESDWMKLFVTEPKLNVFTFSNIEIEKEKFNEKFEKLLKVSVVHFKKIENQYECVSIIHGVKFNVNIEFLEDKINLEFVLRTGEIKEFRKFIKKLEKSIK